MDLLIVKYEAISVLLKERKLLFFNDFQNSVNEILAFISVNSCLANQFKSNQIKSNQFNVNSCLATQEVPGS